MAATRRAPLVRVAIVFVLLFCLYAAAVLQGGRVYQGVPLRPALMLAAVLLALPLGNWLGGRGYAAFGLDSDGRAIGLGAAMLLIGIATEATALILGAHLGLYRLGPAGMPTLGAAGMMTGAAFVPVLAQQLPVRGLWLKAGDAGWNGTVFALVTAALFVASHVDRLHAGWPVWASLFVQGLAYSAAAWKWRSLWPALGLQWGYQLAALLTAPMAAATGRGLSDGHWFVGAVHLGLLAVLLLIPGGGSGRSRASRG